MITPVKLLQNIFGHIELCIQIPLAVIPDVGII